MSKHDLIETDLHKDVVDQLRGSARPVMKNAPTWARWAARDGDGAWHWFECKPKWMKHGHYWWAKGEIQPCAS